ncbi:hypothetical protein C9I56_26480 [Paraburkholderia caribensis]|nr:hypothetical protein C9I56_26480 [Paraburkholderia caribensis]
MFGHYSTTRLAAKDLICAVGTQAFCVQHVLDQFLVVGWTEGLEYGAIETDHTERLFFLNEEAVVCKVGRRNSVGEDRSILISNDKLTFVRTAFCEPWHPDGSVRPPPRGQRQTRRSLLRCSRHRTLFDQERHLPSARQVRCAVINGDLSERLETFRQNASSAMRAMTRWCEIWRPGLKNVHLRIARSRAIRWIEKFDLRWLGELLPSLLALKG